MLVSAGTFAWDNDSSGKAAVHCVIIGFSFLNHVEDKKLWEYATPRSNPIEKKAKFINAYLIDGPNILIAARKSPFSKQIPPLLTGNEPRDGGFLYNLDLSEVEIVSIIIIVENKFLNYFNKKII